MTNANKICEGCGARALTETAKFCPRCGTSLPGVSAQQFLQSAGTGSSDSRVPGSPPICDGRVYLLSRWAKWLTVVLGIYAFAALALAAIMQSLSEIADRGARSRAQFEQMLPNLEGATNGYHLGAIASLVLLAGWSWRVAANAQNWGPPKRSPTWTAASWFCPFANLFVPYASLKDAWGITARMDSGSASKDPPLLAAFICFWGSKFFYVVVGNEPTTLSELSAQMNLLAIAFLVEGISLILMIKSVRAISAHQDTDNAV